VLPDVVGAFELVVHGERLHWTADGAAVAEARYRGTHTGPFLGIPPTGRSIDLPIAVVVTFEDGLMAGERFYYDLATLLRQLGVESLVSLVGGQA
jgi:predicted ester cyclase